jgi:hypothetical protein
MASIQARDTLFFVVPNLQAPACRAQATREKSVSCANLRFR